MRAFSLLLTFILFGVCLGTDGNSHALGIAPLRIRVMEFRRMPLSFRQHRSRGVNRRSRPRGVTPRQEVGHSATRVDEAELYRYAAQRSVQC